MNSGYVTNKLPSFFNGLFSSLSCRRYCSTNIPKHVDVLIVGGAVMGSSVAYNLKNRNPNLNIAVVERDLNYSQSATALSVSSIRQQFSLKENVQLSSWSYGFISQIGKHLKIKNEDPPDIQFHKRGYLFLCTSAGLSILNENVATQRSVGAKTVVLSSEDLKRYYPWMNTEGLVAGSIGMECEGHFDPWLLLQAFKKKASSLGVNYIDGNVTKLSCNGKTQVSGATVETHNGTHKIKCGSLVNTGGPWANAVTQCLGVKLPVLPRKRYVYVFKAPKGPHHKEMPMLIDNTGAYCRPEGTNKLYICGRGPVEGEPHCDDLIVDYNFFDEFVWPCLAERVPSFNELKLQHSWAGYYEYNTMDQNAIIGSHPTIRNLYFANGFSGHGIQQSPAVGNAIAELIIEGKYIDIDLSRFSFDRVLKKQPLLERNII